MAKTKPKQKKRVHINSIASYAQHVASGKTANEHIKIIHILINSKPITDREIALALGYHTRGEVAPRVTELIDAGVLEEVGSTKDEATNRKVRIVGIRRRQEVLFNLKEIGE